MGFLEATTAGFRNTLDFTGRASRPEFWWFLLANVIVIPLGLFVLLSILSTIFPPLILIYLPIQLWVFIAITSICIRRIRDAGGSVWWYLGQYIAGLIIAAALYPAMSEFFANIDNPEMAARAVEQSLTQGGASMVILMAGIGSFICSIVCLVYYFKPSK
jgi:uncharacterized membrane protein YhaH (DUF805 family)